jgi:hypothetical protein
MPFHLLAYSVGCNGTGSHRRECFIRVHVPIRTLCPVECSDGEEILDASERSENRVEAVSVISSWQRAHLPGVRVSGWFT